MLCSSFSLLIFKPVNFVCRAQVGEWWASCGAKRQRMPPPLKLSWTQKVGYTTLRFNLVCRLLGSLGMESLSNASRTISYYLCYSTLFYSLIWCTVCLHLQLHMSLHHSEGRQSVSYDIDSERDEGGDGSYDEEERRASISSSTLPTPERDIYGNLVRTVHHIIA